ncbi:MAG: hypothetical protein Q7J07_08015 [Pelolinea sp.]|nr:hypothetical protein [Pelolinea sp.]
MNIKTRKSSKLPAILTWLLFGSLGFLSFREFFNLNILAFIRSESLFASRRFIVFLATSIISTFLWAAYYFVLIRRERPPTFSTIDSFPTILKYLFFGTLFISPALLKWIIPLPENFTLGSWTMVFLFYLVSIISLNFISREGSILHWLLWVGIFFMLSGAGYSIFSKLDLVTSYPFPTYWSEGNRFFDYSTLFGSYRYIFEPGEKIKAFISWGMQLPWALPFIFPNLSIGGFRLWYQLVWIIPSLLLGWLAISNKKNKNNFIVSIIFALWVYLFLDQGPIYAPLIIAAILTIIAVRLPLTPGAILIIIASYYAHSARWTWGYAPGIWAGLLALLFISGPSFKKKNLRQLVKPIILGIAGYLGGQLLPSVIRAFTNQLQVKFLPNPVASTTRQPLLWDRLFPNPTYPPGIILGLVWAAMPVVIFLIILVIKKSWKINWLQGISVFIVASSFLIVGIIASTKIGGGSNLHNLDMFLVSLVLISSAAVNHLLADDPQPTINKILLILSLLAVFIAPVAFTLQNNERLELPSNDKTAEAMAAVQNKIEEYSVHGNILFIDHRQLLTFGLVKNVPLVDAYEKKYLMDHALADNESYFQGFYKDIFNHEFVLIVNEPSNIIARGSEYSFGEENDAYVKWVTAPLLCMYEPLYTSQATSLELLIPRTSPPPETLPCEDIFSFLND